MDSVSVSRAKLLYFKEEGRRVPYDCYDGSKGNLCKKSIEIMYFANYLSTEDDVRAMQPKASIDFYF